MPVYRHVCTECSHAMEILRSFDDYLDKPKESDPDWKPCLEGKEHNWTKELGKFLLAKSPGWGSKGNWGK